MAKVETQEQEIEETVESVEQQPTVEDLQRQIAERDAELERKENAFQSLRGENKRLQRLGSKAEVEALRKDFEGFQEFIAGALDDVVTRASGEYEEKPTRTSYKEQIKAKKEVQPQMSPMDQEIMGEINEILDKQGWELEGKEVREATKGAETPYQALKMLRSKIGEMEKTETEKKITEDKEKLYREVKEKVMKDLNLTGEGAGAPSGASSSFEKLEQDFADGKVDYTTYAKARQERNI